MLAQSQNGLHKTDNRFKKLKSNKPKADLIPPFLLFYLLKTNIII